MLFRKVYETLHADPNVDQFAYFMRSLESCERFVFSEAATAAAMSLAESPRQLQAAQAEIFAPFPLCWFEFAGENLAFAWLGSPAKNPHRQGSLISVKWNAARSFPYILPALADLDNPDSPFASDPYVVEKLDQFDGKVGAYPTTAEYHNLLPLWRLAVLASWAMLATKGMTASIRPDFSKLNKQRARKGLYPLHGYQHITLNLDIERQIGKQVATATGTMPLHTVRAHLRLLATGKVVVVRAHQRGNPQFGIRKAHYEVIKAEDLA